MIERDGVRVWGTHIEEATIAQAARTARLPVVEAVALMPDAHIGIGATIGSVIATPGAIIPSAVGVDIGCGMVALRTDVTTARLPDDLGRLLKRVERAVPAGVGSHHERIAAAARRWIGSNPPPHPLTDKQTRTTLEQFGTLGSGNHFFEISHDADGRVWIVLHSGSRGIGNQLAMAHMKRAKHDLAQTLTSLEDPDLAWFTQGTEAFDAYIADMRWAQAYAMENRARMVDEGARVLFEFLGFGHETERVNCHHNFADLEEHEGKTLWITRKGAIRARRGDLGIVPGSMGAPTYIVRGLGNPASFESCAHGAGRAMSRTQARKTLDVEDLKRRMRGRAWNEARAMRLLDEAPQAYKDIGSVMAAQSDLVEVVHVLESLVNYKGQ